MENVKINDITDIDIIKHAYKENDYLWTRSDSAIRKFVINHAGQTEEVVTISFVENNDTEAKNLINDYRILSSEQNKILTKIIDINSNEDTFIELFLPNGETQRKLNNYYKSILKRKKLLYIGSEFYISYEIIEDGLSIKIEPYNIDTIEIDNIYQSIFNKLGSKC